MANDNTDDKTPMEVTETAADWLDRLAANSVSATDRQAFARWLLKSPVHVGEFLQLSALRAALTGSLQRHPEWVDELLQADSANVLELTNRSKSKTPSAVHSSISSEVSVSVDSLSQSPAKRPHRLWATAAAIAVITVASWFGYTTLTHTPTDSAVIATAVGEQRSILLSDGSTLELNTETKVRIRMSEHARDIDLLRGELMVDVAKDPDRPFRVLSDGIIAQAIGTRFNVYKRVSDTVVTVIEGRVAVNKARPASNTTQASGAIVTTEPVELTAGLQIAVANQTVASYPLELQPSLVNLDKATAWTERRLVFDDEPLSAIVTEFNRYNPSRLIIADAALRGKRLSGVFDANDPDEFVALLSSLERIAVQQTSEGHRTLLRAETPDGAQ